MRRRKALFKGDVVSVGNVTVADSREGFVSWSDRGVLVFRPGTYTIPKPINEMAQADLDACWTPDAADSAKRPGLRSKPRKRSKPTGRSNP